MRLAEHVAHTVDVDDMLSRMTHEQFDEWCAKDLVEPIGQKPVYEVLARIGVMIAGLAGRETTERTFAPWMRTPKHVVTPAESAIAITQQLAIAVGKN